jgi:GAF domain-containing protein
MPDWDIPTETKALVALALVTFGCDDWCLKCEEQADLCSNKSFATLMHNDEQAKNSEIEEISLPENLLPLGSILGQGVTPMDACMVLAKVFRVQYTEVALLRLEGGLLRFIFPEHLRTSGSIPISSSAVAAHTALSKKAEIFNNFARVKHASIFEAVKPTGADSAEPSAPAPIQKLMSVPIMDQDSNVLGVIQISRKGADSRFAPDFSRDDLHDLEIAADLLANSSVLLSN